MRYFAFFLALFINFSIAFNAVSADKQPSLDELLAQLATVETDSEKLPIYTEIVKATWRNNSELAADYGQQALKLHDNNDAPDQEAQLIGFLTRVYLDRRDLITAEKLTVRGIKAAKQAGNERALTLNLFNKAHAYGLQDKLVLALNSYQDLATAYQKVGNTLALGSVYNNIGTNYFKLGDLKAAFDSFQKALPLTEKSPNRGNYANILMNIGRVFYHLEDYQQSEANYLLGLAEIDQASYPISFLEAHISLARLYNKMGQYAKSLEHFRTSEQVAIKHNYHGKLLVNYYGQIGLAIELKNRGLQDELMAKIETLVTPNLTNNLKDNLYYIRALYQAEQKLWQQAENNIDIIINNNVFESRYYSLQESLDLAIKIKSELGKLEEANSILQESLTLYKKQTEENKSSLLAQYAQLYKVSQKEQEVQQLKEQSLLQQNTLLLEQKQNRQRLFIFVVAIVLFISALLLFIQRNRNLTRQNNMSQQLLNDKKQFFADISHELRTPLTVFKLKMEELEYDIADDPKAVYQLLHERIDSFNHLINDISLLAQNDQGELELNVETVELLPFFESRAADLTALASKHNLVVETSLLLSTDTRANFDPARIRQVLVNLFSNACRYTDSPGLIHFQVSITTDTLELVIEDSAPSLSEQQLAKVFDRLYRTDKSRSRKLGGSGLGLSICQNLVQAHKGNIIAERSRLGGIKITIHLPLSA
ncbi:tetratricopeptide repeat protein [Endozoicomonas sp. G2_1]|uniref:ATP-binding protein n=1 Tax=Endozoicomonas sp. G2_1 TaxID=2821091 RepID=UPI001ADCAE76|nr:ATP-binding protein [Endozoicomonas sp. G2_1]MBO9490117.1 tetratricopeptide repeat protein [Endozoicomonas sp. G2_1]